MGEWVTAQEGDSFCSIAAACGFVNCEPLINHAANAEIAGRQLQPRDRVYVPDITERRDSAPTETVNRYQRLDPRVVRIRFVRDEQDQDVANDPEAPYLEVSGYKTDRAGTSGTDAFAGANHWQFHRASSADPRAFKVELIHPRAGAARLQVQLEVLHPRYLAGVVMVGWDENWSSAGEAARRRQEITVHRATPQPDQRYRSPYLRLVVDEQDKAGRQQQTLLTTDDQANEEVLEILDQKVRATYVLESCTRAADVRCRAVRELEVSERARKRYFRLCVGVFRRNPGDAVGIGGVDVPHVRRRVFRWLRRAYAQANMAPKVIDPGIRLLDPPSANMLTISNINGNPASGRTSAGVSPSRMRFTLTADRGGGVIVSKNVDLPIPRPATPAERPTPLQVANDLVAQINDANFTATAFENSPCLQRPAHRRSVDILVRDSAGGRVTITRTGTNPLSTDRTATLAIVQVNLNAVPYGSTPEEFLGSMQARSILRNFRDVADSRDRLDCFVVGRVSPGFLGRAFLACLNLHADYRPPAPIPYACIVNAETMDQSDRYPYVLAHELGHVLLDAWHTNPGSELMYAFAQSSPGMGRSKRLPPIRRAYGNFHPNQTHPGHHGNFYYSTAERLEQLSRNELRDLFDSW